MELFVQKRGGVWEQAGSLLHYSTVFIPSSSFLYAFSTSFAALCFSYIFSPCLLLSFWSFFFPTLGILVDEMEICVCVLSFSSSSVFLVVPGLFFVIKCSVSLALMFSVR